MQTFIFTLTFLSEKDILLRCKVNSVRHTFLTLAWVKLCKRPVNSEPTRFVTFIINGKAFHSLDGMACSYQFPNKLQQLLPGQWQVKRS